MDTKEKLIMIKKVLENNIGRKVLLKIKKGRQECVEIKGVIEDAFSSFFTVEVVNEENKVRTYSYSYFDVLTSVVSIKAN